MKTIEVTDEIYDALMEPSKEITTQNHRGTAQPYFFQIMTDNIVATPEGIGTEAWYMDGGTIVTEDEIKEAIFEYKGWDIDSQDNLNDYDVLDNFDKDEVLETIGYRKVWYDTKQEFENAFLTDKSCRAHIERNKHHYRNPSTYLTHAFRNPDLETIFKFLAGLSGKEIHT